MEITKEQLQGYRSKKDEIAELDYILKNRWRDEGLIGFQSTPPMQGATAISAKNSSSFSAEIDKLSFQILKFPLFSSPLRLQNTPFVHI